MFSLGSEPDQLKKSVKYESYIDVDDYVCTRYYDTMTNKSTVFIMKEMLQDSIRLHKIIDFMEFSYQGCSQMYVGGIDSNKTYQHETYLIVFEHCYDTGKSNNWRHDTKQALIAWVFNKTTLRLEKVDTKKLYTTSEFEGYGLEE